MNGQKSWYAIVNPAFQGDYPFFNWPIAGYFDVISHLISYVTLCKLSQSCQAQPKRVDDSGLAAQRRARLRQESLSELDMCSSSRVMTS